MKTDFHVHALPGLLLFELILDQSACLWFGLQMIPDFIGFLFTIEKFLQKVLQSKMWRFNKGENFRCYKL